VSPSPIERAEALAKRAVRRLIPAPPPGPATTGYAGTGAPGFPVVLDYPVKPLPRWGYGRPQHRRIRQRLDAGRERYAELLGRFLDFADNLVEIPLHEPPAYTEPYWVNGWITGLDSVALYGMLAVHDPATYLEIGSGTSTKFARKAIRDHGLRTRIVSIDPLPRSSTDAICDQIVRYPLEDADLSVFDQVRPGDVVFMDGSHRALQNSDVCVFFLEVLPELPPGVLVHVHDIQLPDDYPWDWAPRYYSELYMLAAHLLADGGRTEVVLPNYFICKDPELSLVLQPLWSKLGLEGTDASGVGFWFRTPA
jgi:hypothetical protein